MSDCIFCRIVAGEIPAKIVHRDDDVVAFRDVSPQAPVHVLVVPVRHVASLAATTPADDALVARVFGAARDVAAKEGLDTAGYRVVANHGASAGQSVFHFHVHVLGGRALSWPPG